ncbi:ATP-binding protein [Paenibacillus chondroitinus]|uniref:histidine kinase n=1 Tax=Paenibacillus chondroitinus TaxID=59842 RepID=A0ABU6DHX2_9BACL|nr:MULTISPECIES: HAMP domain-containing sensor histidine kinase [Paenibacillus]MCY9659517.1 ATP-binding protein [Paenibacillus anseongense]MEB4796912.1 ATP-binding protein [Paenibacillus chondroitinus]
MKWNRIVIKLGGTIILLFLVVLLPVGFVINQIFSGFYFSKVQEDIDQLSSRYADAIASTQNPTMVKMMADFSQVKLYIVDVDGQIIVDSGLTGLSNGSFISKDEVQALAKGNAVNKRYQDFYSGTKYLVSGKSIKNGNLFYGGVYVLYSTEGIQQSIQKVRDLLILSGIGAFFIALGFTFIISRKLSDPLIQMEQATRKIAKGDLDTRVDLIAKDEMGSLANAINDLAVDLQRYRDTRSEFFANISHELRTPMTYLEGYAKVVKEGLYENEEERNQYLDIIQQETIRLTHLIHDLFELSKMEEGKISLNFEWIDLVELIENVTLKAGLKAKEKGLEIEVSLERDLPMVYADGLRMEQIFLNLVENAIRYTEKGTVSVQLKRLNANEIKIIVEDTGIGIPKQELPYIFERFYRVEKSRSRQYGGTGLGLAIVKRLVDLQGGTIEVTSEIGRGTRFVLCFPIQMKEERRNETD